MKTNGMCKRLVAAALLMGMAAGAAQAGIRDRLRDGPPSAQHPPRVARAIELVLRFENVEDKRQLRKLGRALHVIDSRGVADPDVLGAVQGVVATLLSATDEMLPRLRGQLPVLPERKREKAEQLLDRADRLVEEALGLRDARPALSGRKLARSVRVLLRAEKMMDPEHQPNLAGVTFINGERANHRHLVAIESETNVRIDRGGRFWYDRTSGAWGFEHGKAEGFIMAGLEIGGEMAADVSGGNSGVSINGRELRQAEVDTLEQLINMPLPAGNYQLLDNAELLTEDNGHVDNLLEAARRNGTDASFYRFTVTDSNVGPDDRVFLMGAQYSVTIE